MGVLDVRPTSVTYIDNIVRPRPLPPLSQSLPSKERKRYKVIESLLESEAAFLTSLNIAIEIYKKPLESHNNTELTQDEIKNLFGPVVSILEHHELFFSALSEQTGDWTPDKQIGDLFLASFGKKDVTKCYRIYVNNFTKAMSILEMAIKKKPKFLDFLKRQIQRSGSALSLQAILLKPIQRFPQYILFLQDLIKYTPADHPDSIIIEMAKANIEQIAKYLNEAKKTSEQRTIMKHLISKIERLPSNLLNEHTTQLVRQDIIQWMTYKNGKWIGKERNLLLFNHVLVCCTLKKKDRNATKASVIEADQVMSGEAPRLVCKWFCNIPVLEIIQPDYSKDDIPLVISTDVEKNTELIEKFKEIQNEIKKLGHDFQLLAKISGLIGLLKNNYPVKLLYHMTLYVCVFCVL
jgi:Rho guanine nucleotide exchange factor 10